MDRSQGTVSLAELEGPYVPPHDVRPLSLQEALKERNALAQLEKWKRNKLFVLEVTAKAKDERELKAFHMKYHVQGSMASYPVEAVRQVKMAENKLSDGEKDRLKDLKANERTERICSRAQNYSTLYSNLPAHLEPLTPKAVVILADSKLALLRMVQPGSFGYWLVVQDLLADAAEDLEINYIDRELLAQHSFLLSGGRVVDPREIEGLKRTCTNLAEAIFGAVRRRRQLLMSRPRIDPANEPREGSASKPSENSASKPRDDSDVMDTSRDDSAVEVGPDRMEE